MFSCRQRGAGAYGSNTPPAREVAQRLSGVKEPRIRLAMVALNDAVLPDPNGVRRTFQDGWPDDPSLAASQEEAEAFSLDGSDVSYIVALVRAPIPWSDLEGPCETAWHWPEARAELEQHNAHLIVTASSARLDAIDLMLGLTRTVAAVALCSAAAGVYWGGGTQVHPMDDFVEQSQQMSREYLPLFLWLRFGLASEEDGTSSLFTTGLAELELMEIEFPHSSLDPETLIDRAYNFAHYLLDNGPILEDGNTIGGTPEEKFRVRHVPSMWEAERSVYSFTLES